MSPSTMRASNLLEGASDVFLMSRETLVLLRPNALPASPWLANLRHDASPTRRISMILAPPEPSSSSSESESAARALGEPRGDASALRASNLPRTASLAVAGSFMSLVTSAGCNPVNAAAPSFRDAKRRHFLAPARRISQAIWPFGVRFVVGASSSSSSSSSSESGGRAPPRRRGRGDRRRPRAPSRRIAGLELPARWTKSCSWLGC